MTPAHPHIRIDEISAMSDATPTSRKKQTGDQRLHRISVVRQQQGISLRTAARQMGEHASKLKAQEQGSTDLTLSQLYAWQKVLDVPVSDLLLEAEGPLSRPVMQRAQMLRLMKTAAAISESATNEPMRRMTENLVNQLIEIMPELREVGAWHSVGQRRSQDEYGMAYERRLADEGLADAS